MDVDLNLIEEVNCATCGIRFGVAQVLLERRREDHQCFYCPNGHGNEYPAPVKPRDEELDELRERLNETANELLETQKELASARAWADRVATERRPLLRRQKRENEHGRG